MDLETVIADLQQKTNIEDSNLIIVEDDEDTKQSTVSSLKKAFNGDSTSPANNLFYTSEKVKLIQNDIEEKLSKKAAQVDLTSVEKRLADIVANNGDGNKDNELIDARDGEPSLQSRLVRDRKVIDETKLQLLKKETTVSAYMSIELKAPAGLTIGSMSIVIDYNDPTLSGQVEVRDSAGNSTYYNVSYPKYMIDTKVDTNGVTITTNIEGSTVNVTYEAYIIDTQYLYDRILELQEKVGDTKDKCGLIDNYGEYVFFDELFEYEEESAIFNYSDKYNRNGHKSLELLIRDKAMTNPYFTVATNPTEFDTFTLNYLVDYDIMNAFDSNDAFEIILSSDNASIYPANYYTCRVASGEMVNGWNHLRKSINDMEVVGTPDHSSIRAIKIRVLRNDSANNKTIVFNSIVLNQAMVPTLLMCFDGYYSKGMEYTYPYLYSRNIPFTVFTNEGTTLSNDNKLALMDMIYNHGCEISVYGCHPHKEILNESNNSYEQYQALRTSKKYVQELFCDKPVSFSVPYGNLQNITIPLLKDLGYGIYKVDPSVPSYCAFFSEKDYCMPSININNNTTAEEIIEQIDYAISTGQCISLCTNNITEYGDEINAKQMMFETIVDAIVTRIDSGKLQCMNYSQFYNTCMNK